MHKNSHIHSIISMVNNRFLLNKFKFKLNNKEQLQLLDDDIVPISQSLMYLTHIIGDNTRCPVTIS